MYRLTSRGIELGWAEVKKMTIQEALDRSLEELHSGGATVEECLAEYPQYARELAPLLRTASRLEATDGVRPTRAFKSRLRKQLAGKPEKSRHGLVSLPALVFWILIILIVAGFAVWMGITFEVAGHPGPRPAPVNYWSPSSQIERMVDTVTPSPLAEAVHIRTGASLYSRENARSRPAMNSWIENRQDKLHQKV